MRIEIRVWEYMELVRGSNRNSYIQRPKLSTSEVMERCLHTGPVYLLQSFQRIRKYVCTR